MTEIAAEARVRRTYSSVNGTVLPVLLGLSFCHMLNDTMQSLVPALYPMLKTRLGLDYAEIGLITLTFQVTGSLLQPIVGIYTDRRPQPYSLSIGMGFTLLGLFLLSVAQTLPMLLMSAALIGTGSSVFHPESSRMARLASGGRHGFAQSFFQVGGNIGSSLGPLLAAFIVLPYGQGSVVWFSAAALTAMFLLFIIGNWYRERIPSRAGTKVTAQALTAPFTRRRTAVAIGILLVLIFSKYFYMASIGTYFPLYLMERFHLPIDQAQLMLFMFLGSVAIGTFAGGPLGDRFGRKYVIWGSILGVLPFTLALPYADLFWTGVLTIPIGLILSSAFAAILVYAQELVPGKVGTISGLFFGFAFGMGGIGAGSLGWLADQTSIIFVYQVTAFLPALGILAAFLPNPRAAKA